MLPDYLYPLIGALGSLLCVYASFRFLIHYQSQRYAPQADQERIRRQIFWAQVSLMVSGLAFAFSLFYLIDMAGSSAQRNASTTRTPGEATGLSTPTRDPFAPLPGALTPPPPTSAVQTASAPGITPAQGVAIIGNTNTFGANVRIEPGLNFESLLQLSDGSRVELLGEMQSVDGFNWQHVRLEDGRTGWVAENFLILQP
jgi:hypothetical protein